MEKNSLLPRKIWEEEVQESKQPAIRESTADDAETVDLSDADLVYLSIKRHKSSDSKKPSPPENIPYTEEIPKCINLKNMAGSSSSDLYHIVDDFYFSALHDVEEIFPISDEKYAEELQLQEALISSSAVLVPSSSSLSSSKQPLVWTSSESSKVTKSFCNICMDTKSDTEMFHNTNVCGHLFCFDCIREHVAAKIKQNLTSIMCPDPKCKAKIGPEVCQSIVPKEVLERWETILCESLIMESDKFYCPFKDCSVMLVDDGGVAVTSSECPNCNRLFCAQCKVAWHCGMNCIEYQSMKKGVKSPDELLLINLAKDKKWMKCSKCNYFVEKIDGCQHISCRCGHHFCYGCGKPYISGNHVCAGF